MDLKRGFLVKRAQMSTLLILALSILIGTALLVGIYFLTKRFG